VPVEKQPKTFHYILTVLRRSV